MSADRRTQSVQSSEPRSGFTLLELLVVIAMIGILVTLLLRVLGRTISCSFPVLIICGLAGSGPVLGSACYFLIMYCATGSAFEGFNAQRFFPNQTRIGHGFHVPGALRPMSKPLSLYGVQSSAIDRAPPSVVARLALPDLPPQPGLFCVCGLCRRGAHALIVISVLHAKRHHVLSLVHPVRGDFERTRPSGGPLVRGRGDGNGASLIFAAARQLYMGGVKERAEYKVKVERTTSLAGLRR